MSLGMLRNTGWSVKSDCQVCGTSAFGQAAALNPAPWKAAGTSSGLSKILSFQSPLSDATLGLRALRSVASATAARASA